MMSPDSDSTEKPKPADTMPREFDDALPPVPVSVIAPVAL